MRKQALVGSNENRVVLLSEPDDAHRLVERVRAWM